MDDQAYLEPGFDPSSLTVPRLRSILLAHSINYPSSAKKPQLIEIFNEQVVPQARKILSANARVKRTSRGIEDVTTGRKGAGAGDEVDYDEDRLRTQATPGGRSGRRTTRARTEEAEEVLPTPRSTRHSTAPPEATPRRSSSKHGRQVESIREETEPKRPSSRKSKTPATPAFKVEAEDDDSPFSNNNVFQSGSSPPLAQTFESDRRRTTQSAVKDLERRSRELRRRTDEVTPYRRQGDETAAVPLRRTFEFPVQSYKQEEIEPSEEFTPEGQQEIVQAQQAGELVPARKTKKRRSSGPPQAVGVIFVIMLAVLSYFWSEEKFNVGYCGVGAPTASINNYEIPEWADVLRPQCEPCRPHAYCHERLRTECEKGFVLEPHPFTLNGLLPLPFPPTCRPDGFRARQVNSVKERVISELRTANAKYECGEATKAEVQESALKSQISKARRTSMSGEEFEDLWADAIGEVIKADEIVSGSDGTGHATLRSTSHAAIPLACAIRRSLRATFRQYFWYLVAVLVAAGGAGETRRRIVANRTTQTRAKQLARLALEKLSTQASLHATDPAGWPERFMPVAQLRDDVLRDDFSTASRRKLWELVAKKVEGNANVRPMVRESGTGDVGRVWEWVGAVGMLDSPQGHSSLISEGGDRRKSGRVSFANEDRLIGQDGESAGAVVRRRDGNGEARKWDEGGRSYY